jgi:Ricin-type beta-trefoil lectin domain
MRTARRSITTQSARRLSGALIALGAAIGLAVAAPGVASAGTVLPGLVSSVPSSTTPNIFPGDASTGVNSSGCSTTWFGTDSSIDCLSTVYSEAIVNGEVVVVGAFTQVCQPGTAANGYCTPGTLVTRDDIFAYSLATGAIDPNFAPQIDQGPIYAVAAGPAGSNTVYIGGGFSTINGTSQGGIAQLNVTPSNAATDGTLVTAFKGHVSNLVDELALSPDGTALYAGGQFTTADSTAETAIVRFNATTGAVDPSFKFTLSNPENGAALKVEAMTLSPDGSHLVIGGTFLDVANSAYDGGVAQSRPRMAVVDTGTTLGATASLADFTAPIMANNCSAEHDYVRAVDFGAGGSYIAVGTTGYLSAGGPSICDAVARFNLTATGSASTGTAADVSPAWINFSGGDSFYAVDTSGPIVYAAGHNRWVNNQCGVDSLCAPNAVLVDGVAALDANTGLALPWWEPQTTRGHGTQFLSTFPAGLAAGSNGGLLLGTDVSSVGGAFHGETAMFPLTSTASSVPGGPIPSGLFDDDGGSNSGTDMCIDEAGDSTTSGAAVQLADCSDAPEQNWTLAANGTIQINGLCLDTQNGATASGTQLVADACSGAKTQQWAQGTGNSVTNGGAPGMCLDDPGSSTTSGTKLDIATCNGGSNQVWPLPAAQAPPAGPPVGPVFSPLISNDNELCMDDSNNSTTSGAVVDIYPCSGSVQQNWTIGTNSTIQVHGLCLDTQGGATASGTDVVLDSCNGGNSQVWTVGATYALVNKAANLCLADPNSSTTKGTQLIISSCNGGKNEQWRLPAV